MNGRDFGDLQKNFQSAYIQGKFAVGFIVILNVLGVLKNGAVI